MKEADIRLDAVTRREQSLSLFHALGKVFYNKRLDDPPTEQDDQEAIDAIRCLPVEDALPEHLNGFSRRKSMIQMEVGVGSSKLTQLSPGLYSHYSRGRVDICAVDSSQCAPLLQRYRAARGDHGRLWGRGSDADGRRHCESRLVICGRDWWLTFSGNRVRRPLPTHCI